MDRVRLLLRGLWWRRGLAVAVFGVAVITTAAAALGPLYARAAAESILQDHLVQGGAATGLNLDGQIQSGSPGALGAFDDQARQLGHVRGFDRVVHGMYTLLGVGAYVPRAPLGSINTFLLWRQDQCAHVVVVQGRCPTGPDDAMANERDVAGDLVNFHVGQYVQTVAAHRLRIVGVYRPKNIADPYWSDRGFFNPHGQAGDDKPTTAPLLLAESGFLALPGDDVVQAEYDYALTPREVRLADVSSERSQVKRLLSRGEGVVTPSTGLLRVLAAAEHEHHLIDVATLLVVLQLALLAWLVLFQVVGNALDARGDEIAMAKLRGYGPWATLRFGLGEPLVLLVLAIPVGIVVALGVAHLFASAVLVAGVPVLVPVSTLYAALVAFAGALVAALLAAQKTLTRSVLDQWRHTERRPGHGVLSIVVDVVLAAGAIIGLVLLLRTHTAAAGNTTALLAPALLVFAVGIVGVRLLPLLCRRIAAASRGTRRIGTFLASAQVARRSAGLRLAALLAVAVGLATFGVAGESVASGNRAARADAEVGAAQMLGVQFPAGLDPVRAARRADPAGRWAMATATWLPDGGLSVVGTVLGVDPTRLATVAAPVRGSLSQTALAHELLDAPVPQLTLRTTAVRIALTARQLRGGARPDVQLNLRSARNPFLDVEGPALQPGRQQVVLHVPCQDGCTLRGITWDRPINASRALTGVATLTGLSVQHGGSWRAVPIGLGTQGSWYAETPQGQAGDKITITGDGIVDRFSNRNGGYGGIAYGADPVPIPAVVTPASMATDVTAPKIPRVTDELSYNATFTVRRTVPLLPQVLDNGVVMNVQYLEDELPAFASEATWSVWIGPHPPSDYRRRLAAAGLQVVGARTLALRTSQLGRQAPALALLLLLVCALAGAVLAVGGTAISISASSRRRSYELAALRVVGVSRSALLRASLLEHLLLLGAAVILGVPAGYIAARLTMPIIPEFADHTPVPLTYTPHAAPTLAFAAAFVVLLVITALIAARALIRVAVPARLREAE